ncbi:MAG: gliding motility-associated C-terminal domain-containing protein, partial [Chitinophaga sp.]|uniref:MBG domain-containing protein n=1 Tax=Chitinophaga sp. TaxID=1869181 RepID=UPI001B047068
SILSGPATISGNTVTITGAGNVTIAANQAGNATYLPATQVTQSFTVNKATLTVTAVNTSKVYQQPNPAFTYTITGFVNGENNSVVTGTATLSTTATTNSTPGTYPITVAIGSLSAANYQFTLVNGTLTVGQANQTTQTITFPAITNKTYGAAAFTLNATSTSGLPVTYSIVSGPATISGNTVTITGAGIVTIAANQAGNATYLPAMQVTQSFTIGKAALTVTANNDSRTYTGTAYTNGNGVSYSGFVGNDDEGKLGGTLSYHGNSQGAVDAGTYIIQPSGLSSNDYNITYANGQLTITRATQQITFTNIGGKNEGDPDFTLTATSNSGLPVSFSSDNTTVISVNGNTAHVGTAGTVHITATQAGNNNYEPATAVTQTIIVTSFMAPVITANGSTAFCDGNSIKLQATAAPAYEWYRNNVLISNATGSSFSASESGVYTVKAIYNNNVALQSAPVTVTVHPLPDGKLQTSGNTTISKGESITLTASGGNSYEWSPAAGLNDPGIAAPVARPAMTTTYQVTISNLFNCSVTKEVTITVKEDYKLEATNILTPNGDGKNDLWVVKNIDMYPQNEVKVYDRAGRMVFQQRGYTNNWNGKVNGQPLAEGTYYYIITLGDSNRQFKGFITIIHSN